MPEIGLEAARALAIQARANGGQALTLCRTAWDISGDCERPADVSCTGSHFRGRTVKPGYQVIEGPRGYNHPIITMRGNPHEVFLQVRCGRCTKCLRLRRRTWSRRAQTEVARSARTWLCTLTANPERQHFYLCAASVRLRRGGTEWDALPPSEQFEERCKEMGRELTKFVKRVRKQTGAPLRTLWVFEHHRSGLPHVHGLVHECYENAPVRWQTLSAQWKEGFSRFRLLTNRGEATYACKYLSKDAQTRIRASLRYGLEVRKENTPDGPSFCGTQTSVKEKIDLSASTRPNSLWPQS